MAGRKGKLTPQVQAKIVQAIASGNYAEAACQYAGITWYTFRNWMKWGEQARSGIYFTFFQAIRLAEAEAEVRLVALWQSQVPTDWRAAAEFLARRYPDRWGVKVKIDIEMRIRQMAESLGLDPDEAVAEAQRIMAETKVSKEWR